MKKKWCIQLTLVGLFLLMELRPDQIKSARDDGAAAAVIFLPLSGLLDTLAANANGKRTWKALHPLTRSHLGASGQSDVHEFVLAGEPSRSNKGSGYVWVFSSFSSFLPQSNLSPGIFNPRSLNLRSSARF